MAGTVDDGTTDERQPLWKEHLLVLSLTGSSEQWTESVLRAFFTHGPVDPDDRERYRVWQTHAKFLGCLPDGPEARPICNQRDPWFWYSDPEKNISCVFEFRDSSLRWTGPMMRRKASSDEDNKKEDEVWETDPQLKIEYHLQGIELRHEALLDFLRRAGRLPAEPSALEPTAEPLPSDEQQTEEISQESLEPKWDPLADWSVETVFRELEVKTKRQAPALETIVKALPTLPSLPQRLKRYRGKNVVEILDTISGKDLAAAVGQKSSDSAERIKRAWKRYRAKQGIFLG